MKKVLLSTAAMALLASSSYGAGIIRNGNVYLGINDLGHLNIPDYAGVTINTFDTGLTYARTGDATSPGCLCEGWGVSASGVSGFANVAGGTGGLTLNSFTSDTAGGTIVGTTATSNVSLSGLAGVTVNQRYAASVSSALFEDTVTITNGTTGPITDVRYVRVMDWDVPPTEFNEFVTIKGTGTTADLEFSNDQGFASADPLAGDPGEIAGGTTNVDFTDSGINDHGAYFRFNFGSLAAGESKTFSIFYGAADNEAGAISALAAVDAELYSLGQSSSGGVPANDAATYIFAFKGVGGVVIETPDGGQTLGLLAASMGLLGLVKRRLSRRA